MKSAKCSVVFAVFVLLLSPCCSKPALEEEQSVVSIYTTDPTTTNTTKPLDIYQQIATNIAEKITSPIYTFLGLNGNKTESKPNITRKSWRKIELVDIDDVTPHQDPDNDISKTRDREELSPDATPKTEKKPEKITLYSNYLPAKLEVNNTVNEIDSDSFEFDDVENVDSDEGAKAAESGIIWFLEMVGSIFQLMWGGLVAWLKPSSRDIGEIV